MQLYSVEQKRSQALEAHAAAFASLRATGMDQHSLVISFAQKTYNNGVLNSKLHVIELGAQPGISYAKRKELFWTVSQARCSYFP